MSDSSLFSLDGTTSIVTGASSGIGLGLTVSLAEAGSTVYAVARRADRLAELAERDVRIRPIVADLSREEDRQKMVAEVLRQSGRVDVLVNNAGISNITPAVEESTADFEAVLGVNLVAVFGLCRDVGRQMLAQEGGGSIINVASIVGLVGLGRMPQAGYAASKGAVVNLTRELAAQWARKGVRVNAIAPGWFDTELTAELFETDKGTDWVNRLTPMGRAGRIEELCGPVLLLASQAGSYVTGAIIPVDGGWTAV
jgi:NAD(P)-dependent dehydrogenase (short-subunit alcohol dehydrogenase family)